MIEMDDHVVLGKMAVLKEARGMKVGKRLVEEGVSVMKSRGWKLIRLKGQVQAGGFYDKLGFTRATEVYTFENLPHITFEMRL